jgi:integrase/recombinase XerD
MTFLMSSFWVPLGFVAYDTNNPKPVTAMALLQSGVDIAVIALWLGHESIETTNAYLHANLAMKEKALAKVLPVGTPFRRFQANDTLLAFLESL